MWSFVVDLGPDPATGRRRQARRSGYATKKAAEAALRDLAAAADAGTAVSRSRITLSQFLTDWLETIKPRVRETTWVSYRIAVERITRQIGAVQLQSLTTLQVEGLYATLLERGGAGGRALAPKTVRNCHIVLRRALADAERVGLVARNPAAAAKAVSGPRGEQRTWSRRRRSSGSSTQWQASGCRWRSCCWPPPACGAVRYSGCDGRTSTSMGAHCRSSRP